MPLKYLNMKINFNKSIVNNYRNYQFRLYPTSTQRQQFLETLDGCRWIYNYFLEGDFQTEYDMNYALTELKEEETFLRNYHSKMLQMVTKNIASSKKALRSLRRNGHRVGRLKYLKSEDCSSFCYNQSGFDITVDGKLWLSKIGRVKIRMHRCVSNIKQVIIKREGKKWFAVLCCKIGQPIFRFMDIKKSVGIDVGITKFCHDSDNNEISNPLFLKRMLKPLRRASRTLSKCQKDSCNREKSKSRLQILHERIRKNI